MNENFSKSKIKRKDEMVEYVTKDEEERLKQLKKSLKLKSYSNILKVLENMSKESLVKSKYNIEKYIPISFISPMETSLLDMHCSTKFLSIKEIADLINIVEKESAESEKRTYAKYVLNLVKISLINIINDITD